MIEFTAKDFFENMEVIPGECDTYDAAAAVANEKLRQWLNTKPLLCDLCKEAIKKDEDKFQ